MRDLELAHKYGCAARDTIEERYSLEQIMNIYLELYQSLHRGRASASPPEFSASRPPARI